MVLLAPACGAALVGGTRAQHPAPGPSTERWSRVNGAPQASRERGQPYLRDSEAMGLGIGLSFAECFAVRAWQSWERRGKG